MNIVPENKYNINGTIMKGSDVLNTYRNVYQISFSENQRSL